MGPALTSYLFYNGMNKITFNRYLYQPAAKCSGGCVVLVELCLPPGRARQAGEGVLSSGVMQGKALNTLP